MEDLATETTIAPYIIAAAGVATGTFITLKFWKRRKQQKEIKEALANIDMENVINDILDNAARKNDLDKI